MFYCSPLFYLFRVERKQFVCYQFLHALSMMSAYSSRNFPPLNERLVVVCLPNEKHEYRTITRPASPRLFKHVERKVGLELSAGFSRLNFSSVTRFTVPRGVPRLGDCRATLSWAYFKTVGVEHMRRTHTRSITYSISFQLLFF
jgi:hypothetical protein